jgi:hypothetical protein
MKSFEETLKKIDEFGTKIDKAVDFYLDVKIALGALKETLLKEAKEQKKSIQTQERIENLIREVYNND